MKEKNREEKIYRITVRTLYVVALGLNALVIYEQVKHTPEGQALKARGEQIRQRIKTKVLEARTFRKQANEVVFEAITIVEDKENG